MKYTLKKPIALGEGPPVTELHFREEVCAGDMRGVKFSALADPSTDDVIKLASRLCGQPESVVAKLSVVDLLEVTPLVLGFLATGLETGSTP